MGATQYLTSIPSSFSSAIEVDWVLVQPEPIDLNGDASTGNGDTMRPAMQQIATSQGKNKGKGRQVQLLDDVTCICCNKKLLTMSITSNPLGESDPASFGVRHADRCAVSDERI